MLATGCAQPEGTVGSGVGGGPVGVLDSIVCQVAIDTSFQANAVKTGGSAYLYVGDSHGINSESAIRFNRPITPDGMVVDSARLEIAWEGGIGSGAFPTIEAGLLYRLWSESAPPIRTDITGGINLLSNYSSGGDSGRMFFTVDTSEVNAWFKCVDSTRLDSTYDDPARPDTSLTVVLRASNASDRLVRFRARSAITDTLRPYLRLFVTFPDSANSDTVSILAVGDLFLAQDNNPLPSGRLTIGGGAAVRSALNFDLNPIWNRQLTHYVVVNRAVLTLTRDCSSFDWTPLTLSIWPYQMTSKRWMTELDSAEFAGYVLESTAVDTSTDTLQLIVNSPTVNWAKGDTLNYGLMIESATEVLDIDRIAFHDSSDPDPMKRPRLKIYYTELPK